MSRLLPVFLIAVPGTALAHGLPTAHAHPHGIELALGAVVIAAFFAGWGLRIARQRRSKRK